MGQSTEFKLFGLLFYAFLLVVYQYVCRDIRQFYLEKYNLKLGLDNVVLPIRHLVGHALLASELDQDEIAASLSLIYFNIFPSLKS